jgi:hypothetical protein
MDLSLPVPSCGELQQLVPIATLAALQEEAPSVTVGHVLQPQSANDRYRATGENTIAAMMIIRSATARMEYFSATIRSWERSCSISRPRGPSISGQDVLLNYSSRGLGRPVKVWSFLLASRLLDYKSWANCLNHPPRTFKTRLTWGSWPPRLTSKLVMSLTSISGRNDLFATSTLDRPHYQFQSFNGCPQPFGCT